MVCVPERWLSWCPSAWSGIGWDDGCSLGLGGLRAVAEDICVDDGGGNVWYGVGAVFWAGECVCCEFYHGLDVLLRVGEWSLGGCFTDGEDDPGRLEGGAPGWEEYVHCRADEDVLDPVD